MSVKTKDLPKQIKKLAEKRARQNPDNNCVCGFLWSSTKEGHDFWSEIYGKRNYKVFYNKYQKKKSIEQLMRDANYNYNFGTTIFPDESKRFIAIDFREGENYKKAKRKYNDLLPTFYASTLRKVIKKAIYQIKE